MNMKILRLLGMGLFLSLCTGQVLALDEINTPWYGNTAIEGHDPVAYFSDNAAVKGNKSHKLEWKGADWIFANAENKALFQADPEKYAPQFGGYCAWAASQNTVAGIDPDQFTIIDGKLYLNYNEEVKNMWLVDTTKHISDGNQNWPGLLASN